jgi:hypothetical protein
MSTNKVRPWGQADKDLLNDLINLQLINITDTSLSNIEQVRNAHFGHRDKRNFRRNFRNFAAAWDLEIVYSGTRRHESGGKLRRLCSAFFYNLIVRHLKLCLLRCQCTLCLEEEVTDNEVDDKDNNAANNGDGDKDMPPKVKLDAAATATAAKKKAPAAKKDNSDEVAVMPPRAPAKIKNFLIDATDHFLVAYYSKGVNDYADVAIMVNGTIKKGSYDVQVAEDGLSLSWRWASRSECFDKEILKKILGDEYRDSSHRVVAWDNLRM